MVFPVVMYEYKSWTTNKAEHWRTDAFEMWCWRRLLRVPWTARRPNQSILKEISPEYSLKGLRLELKLQYFGHLMRKTDSFEKTLMLGKNWKWEENRTTEDKMVRWHHDSMDMSLSNVQELVMDREAWPAVVHGIAKSQTQLSNWTEYSFVWVDHSLFIHTLTEGHLTCFQVKEIMNKAAVNICVEVFVWTCFQHVWVNTKEHNCWVI